LYRTFHTFAQLPPDARILLFVGALTDYKGGGDLITAVTHRHAIPEPPGIHGAKLLGNSEVGSTGLMLKETNGVLVCLPGNRRDLEKVCGLNSPPLHVVPFSRMAITTTVLVRCITWNLKYP